MPLARDTHATTMQAARRFRRLADVTVDGVRVVVLGAGLMGSQIGCEYALGGCSVTLVARDLDAARERMEAAFDLVRDQRLANASDVAGARSRIQMLPAGKSPPRQAGVHAQLIVESLPEDIDLKAEVLAPIAALERDALVATNTSSIAVGELGEAVGVSERIVGAHYWNPPLLMPLVEVVAGQRTPKAKLDWMVALLRAIGKRPVLLEREVPGLLWNRLQAAVLRESLWLVEQGVASPETIDEAMRDGLARRWRLTGPFQTVGLGGTAVFDAIAANLFPQLSAEMESGSFASHVPVDSKELAQLRARRDEALAADLRAERDQRS